MPLSFNFKRNCLPTQACDIILPRKGEVYFIVKCFSFYKLIIRLIVFCIVIIASVCIFFSLGSIIPGQNPFAIEEVYASTVYTRTETIWTGNKAHLKVKASKVKASKITWKSSNKKIASVNSKGVVTANKVGKATITGKVGSKKYKWKVTVKDLLDEKSISIDKTKTYQLTSQKEVNWKSSNTKVATVSSTGAITGKSYGAATITGTTSKGKTGKVKVRVYEVVTVFLGSSAVRILSENNESYGQYKTSDDTLKFIHLGGSTVDWQVTNPSTNKYALGKGGKKLLDFMRKTTEKKKYVRFHVVLGAPGKTVYYCFNESELQNAGANSADRYNYVYNQLKNKGYNFEMYIRSLNPLEPEKEYTKPFVVADTDPLYLDAEYRSPFKYTNFNSGLQKRITNAYQTKMNYIDFYSNVDIWTNSYKTVDGYHHDSETAIDMFNYIMKNIE